MKNKTFNDWAVALAVIACSVLLFLALAFALSGTSLGKPSRLLRVNFHDVTGVSIGSQVRYAGAIAGRVSEIRMLAAQERSESGDPLNAVQVILAINSNVPPIASDAAASTRGFGFGLTMMSSRTPASLAGTAFISTEEG